jgi:hypothetical protein
MAANLTGLTHNIAIQLHLVAENYTIYSSRSRRPARKLLATPIKQIICSQCEPIRTEGTHEYAVSVAGHRDRIVTQGHSCSCD